MALWVEPTKPDSLGLDRKEGNICIVRKRGAFKRKATMIRARRPLPRKHMVDEKTACIMAVIFLFIAAIAWWVNHQEQLSSINFVNSQFAWANDHAEQQATLL